MVYWTSLREVCVNETRHTSLLITSTQEPVIYVAGRPHVLRLESRPLENVEYVRPIFLLPTFIDFILGQQGVTTAVVEAMEDSFKRDILREVRQGGGRILLHDEVEERPGVFSIIPIWEVVEEKDIMTPRDVFDLIVTQGYRVCFGIPLASLDV
jgi:hypothetical protein